SRHRALPRRRREAGARERAALHPQAPPRVASHAGGAPRRHGGADRAAGDSFRTGMSAQTLSLVIIVAAAFGYVGLERLIPYDRQKVFRPGFWLDLLFYGFFQSWLLGIVIGAVIEKLDAFTGHGRLHFVSSWPIPLQVLFFFVTHDFYIYCFHRLQHRSPIL